VPVFLLGFLAHGLNCRQLCEQNCVEVMHVGILFAGATAGHAGHCDGHFGVLGVPSFSFTKRVWFCSFK